MFFVFFVLFFFVFFFNVSRFLKKNTSTRDIATDRKSAVSVQWRLVRADERLSSWVIIIILAETDTKTGPD